MSIFACSQRNGLHSDSVRHKKELMAEQSGSYTPGSGKVDPILSAEPPVGRRTSR